MTEVKQPAKRRTPQGYDRILKGALALSLKEKGQLRDALVNAIEEEAAELKAKADEADRIAKGV